MTPSAITVAGRGAVRQRLAPGRRSLPRAPRRVSGPVRRPYTTRPGAGSRAQASIAARAVVLLRSLPDHSLLDRLVRGRAWIPLLGVLLAGIVATQVEIMKLGSGIGRSMRQTTELANRNDALQISIASLSDQQRIEQLAARMGMVMPPPTAPVFLRGNGQTDAQRAIASISAPNPTQFASTLASDPSQSGHTSTTDSGSASTTSSDASTTSASSDSSTSTTSSDTSTTTPSSATSGG